MRRFAIVESVLIVALLAACSDATTAPAAAPKPDDPPSTIAVAFCRGSDPAWVAFQDGESVWTRELPTTTGEIVTFRHTFMTNRGAIATAAHFASGLTTLSVWYGAPAELALVGDTLGNRCGVNGPRALLGTVAGVAANDVVSVRAGSFATAFRVDDGSRSFLLSGLVEGPQTILATRATRVNDVTTVNRVILRRTPALPDSSVIPVLDFGSMESFPPAVANVTIAGDGGEGISMNTMLITDNSRSILSFRTNDVNAVTRSYDAIPANKLAAGDLQVLTATTVPTGNNSIRLASAYFHTPVDQTLTMGPPIEGPVISFAAPTAGLQLRGTFIEQPAYDRLAQVTFQQGENTVVSLSMTAAYASLTGGLDLQLPDLASVSGFDPAWVIHRNEQVFWTATRTGGTLGLGIDRVPFDGATTRVAATSGTFTP
jgi:hypothetical protein